ncbi:MAG: HEAT repeat domain-containing protein [Phycisphaerae bacterium]|nr:HEAT repeat domain-containing protein [Phycisphaerae bacterium]
MKPMRPVTMAMAVFLAGCASDRMRPGAESIFAMFAPPTPEEAARMATDEYDADLRFRGTRLLSTAPFAGEAPYIALFVDNADDPDAGVRAVALRALANHGRPEHARILVTALGDSDRLVRWEAARGLQRLHSPAAVEPLLALLKEDEELDASVRTEAATALGQYAEPRVVEALIAALGDPHLAVNGATQASLRTLTGQDLGGDARAWLDWYRGAGGAAFAGRSVFTYPAFSRKKRWYERLPFVPPPPNEPSLTPAGLPPPGAPR